MIGTSDLLTTWEAGTPERPARRALLLHVLARRLHAEEPVVDELLAVPVGHRDLDLFRLRHMLFGDRLTGLVTCLECTEELEFEFDVAAVAEAAHPTADPVTVEVGEWRVCLRLPTPADLAGVASVPDPPAALLAACVVESRRGGEPAPVEDVPADVRRRAVADAAAADPWADVRLELSCVRCGHEVKVVLDIVSYLWAELDAWARATLLDVHLLASTYGWTEPDVLALSPARRRHYLELAGHV